MSEQSVELVLHAVRLRISWSARAPVQLRIGDALATAGALVEVFTATEQRARTSQNYVRSGVGDRLRYVAHHAGGDTLHVDQRDARTGLEVRTTLTGYPDTAAVRIQQRVTNNGPTALVVTAVSSAVAGIGESEDDLDRLDLCWARSEWLAENRWRQRPLREEVPRLSLPVHAQDGRGRFSLTSGGTWSTGEYLPAGILADRHTGAAMGWQIESGGAWHWEISQGLSGATLTLLGPTDAEHHFASKLEPGDHFDTVPAVVAVSEAGRDGALAELTSYRRATRLRRPVDGRMPVVYNDFMNTLMGDPSSERLEPLIEAAARVGVEYFCIDAGWFAHPDDGGTWWSDVGQWREPPDRFTGGLAALTQRIRDHGMTPGLWLEPEVVGVRSPIATALPEEAFFHRFGERVREHDRFHLDFRHPAARRHLDETVDRLVAAYGVGYLKLDYNINPGPGTETAAFTAGEGLLGHSRAYADWLAGVQRRHPELLVENCASGAMRAVHTLVSITHMQSTSDQQDFLLYPPIAVSAPATIPPEQCANWAYPDRQMTAEQTVFCLATGLAGRLYLSGFLHELSAPQRALVAEAVAVSKNWRKRIATATPRWPLGLPAWDDDLLAVALDCGTQTLLVVWNRAPSPRDVVLPAPGAATATVVFPAGRSEDVWITDATVTVQLPAGPSARLVTIQS